MRQKLTDLAVRNAKPNGDKARKMADANGLYLHVDPNGSKYWRYRYRMPDGRERVAALGQYPVLSLADARAAHLEARRRLSAGTDPAQHKRQAKAAAIAAAEATFERCGRQWHTQNSKLVKNGSPLWTPDNAKRILGRLQNHLFPKLGARPIESITSDDLLAVLRAIEAAGKHETAHRCLQYLRGIFRDAKRAKLITENVTADIDDTDLLPREKRHHSRVSQEHIGSLLRAVEAADLRPVTKLALQFVFLTAVRTTEARAARWAEFDLGKRRWLIPKERMKMGEAHLVPLSEQAVALLAKIQILTGDGELLFPNQSRPTECMSNNTMLYALYRAGFAGRQTVHGIRALFSTAANESGDWDRDVVELCLAHQDRDETRAAYNAATRLKDRTLLMQWWADYLDQARAGARVLSFDRVEQLKTAA